MSTFSLLAIVYITACIGTTVGYFLRAVISTGHVDERCTNASSSKRLRSGGISAENKGSRRRLDNAA